MIQRCSSRVCAGFPSRPRWSRENEAITHEQHGCSTGWAFWYLSQFQRGRRRRTPDSVSAAGAEYTTGKYGGETAIEETYVPISLAYDARRVSVRLTVPYLSVQAPEGTVVEGPDGEQIIGEGPVRTEGGIGDVIAALTVYDVLSLADGGFVMDLTGEIKFGTADEDKGLGTGQTDYSVQADAFRFFGRFTAIGSAGYLVRGDPADVDLDNAFFAAAGGTWSVSDRTRLGIFYDYQEARCPATTRCTIWRQHCHRDLVRTVGCRVT